MALRKTRTIPRKMPAQTRSSETVRALLMGTARVLAKEGYERASTNRIAQAAGVSIGSLYQFFPGKEALVAAVFEERLAQDLETIEAKLEEFSDEPLEKLVPELVRTLFKIYAVNPKLRRIMIEQVPRVGRLEQVLDIQTHFGSMLRGYLEKRREQIRPKNLEMAVFLMVQAVVAVAQAVVLRYPVYLEEKHLVDEISTLVLRYLKTESSPG